MIVRIATEGQYRIGDQDLDSLNDLDNEAVRACESGDEKRFREVYDRLLSLVRNQGSAVADEDLEPSDLILPPPDVSLEEASGEFSGEGLIPG